MKDVSIATVGLVVAFLFGGILFQAASLSFDYMKLRGFPLYGSAGSLPEFGMDVRQLQNDMAPDFIKIRGVMKDRDGVIDMEIAQRDDDAANALSAVRTFFRRVLTVDQVKESQFEDAGTKFFPLDSIFQRYCDPSQSEAAASQAAPIVDAGADTTSAGVVAPKAITPVHDTRWTQACLIGTGGCDLPYLGVQVRLNMICTQKALQTAKRRKDAIIAYTFDSSKYLSDVLKMDYPLFTAEKIDTALRVTEGYEALIGCRLLSECFWPKARSAAATATKLHFGDDVRLTREVVLTLFWGWFLGWPLALSYLLLGFVFGVLGSLVKYIYAFIAPIANPDYSPALPVIAGGGSAVLVLIIVMAGFQFLTVGASAPDLAYPNPLTVCGLGVLAGLAGERVLAALQALVGRFFGGGPLPNSNTGASDGGVPPKAPTGSGGGGAAPDGPTPLKSG